VLRCSAVRRFATGSGADNRASGTNEHWKNRKISGSFLHVPRKIRQLVSDLKSSGFVQVHGGKGSHRKFKHVKFPGFVLISGNEGDDAQLYQEKQLRNALRKIQS
jgi:predicted RNA binding protein YcfA (HicA-like mRNA interferase family)